MNAAPLELSHNLLQTIDSLFVENNIAKYFKDIFVVISVVLFFPLLYVAFWIFAFIICFAIHKSFSKNINFTNAEEYRQSRIAYDDALPIAIKNKLVFSKLKELSKLRYFVLYPIILIYLPFEWYCRDVKKEFEKLDAPKRENSLFRSISEEELWERRTKAYRYKL